MWHAMAPALKDGVPTNAQVLSLIVEQAEHWWEVVEWYSTQKPGQESKKAWFFLGHILHMVQDSYSGSHCLRTSASPFKIVQFQGYDLQDSGEHAKWDKSSEVQESVGNPGADHTRQQLFREAQLATNAIVDHFHLRCGPAHRDVRIGGVLSCSWELVLPIIRQYLTLEDDRGEHLAGGTTLALKEKKLLCTGQTDLAGEQFCPPLGTPFHGPLSLGNVCPSFARWEALQKEVAGIIRNKQDLIVDFLPTTVELPDKDGEDEHGGIDQGSEDHDRDQG